jgi:hypothetical protein
MVLFIFIKGVKLRGDTMSDRSPHKQYGFERSGEWSKVRRTHLDKEPNCVYCVTANTPSFKKKLQVHHIIPFHLGKLLGRDDIELRDDNLVTLCEDKDDHHLIVGHLNDFRSFNVKVREQIQLWKGATKLLIEADALYLKEKADRPADFKVLTVDEKTKLRAMIDVLLPV